MRGSHLAEGRCAGWAPPCSCWSLAFDMLQLSDRNWDLQSFAGIRHSPICFAMKFPAVFSSVGAAVTAR